MEGKMETIQPPSSKAEAGGWKNDKNLGSEDQSFSESVEGEDKERLDGEKIYEAVEGFNESKESDAIYETWRESYSENPLSFFDEDNFSQLEKIPASERLVLLARSCHYLTVTPEMVDRYYEKFPDDLKAVVALFEDCDGFPNYTLDLELFSISSLAMEKIRPSLKERYRPFEGYLEKGDRRRIAPSLLLNNFEYKYNEGFKEFGEGADGFLKSLDEAGKLLWGSDHFINPEQIFTPAYEKMPEGMKARFLRKCIAELQFHLVFEETYNSCFTEEMVEDDRHRALENIKSHGFAFHNVAHSMIYGTYQPVSVYSREQRAFEHEMNSTVEGGGYLEEYPFHRLLIAVLDRLRDVRAESEENTDVVVDFWNKNRNPIFGNGVADVLSNQDPDRAASQLLSLIKAEKKSKNSLASILYRLEFDKIGISEEGVRYLERMYDLGEYNNPNYHVSRLTADGEVGIFNEELELTKYFQLGDLTSEEKKIKAKVLDFTYETLFLGRLDETTEERAKRLGYLEEFKKNYYRIAQDKIFETTGVRLNNLSFREQGWFLIYFNQAPEEEKGRLRDFVADYGENGIKTFLSLESGKEMGKKILELGEKLDRKLVKRLFESYALLVDTACEKSQQLYRELSTAFFDVNLSEAELYENLMIRAKDVLLEGHQEMLGDHFDLTRIIKNLKKESTFQEVLHSQFIKITELLGREDVDLKNYSKDQGMILRSLEFPEGVSEAFYLRILNVIGKLKPMPELFWRVDRSSEEYNKRLGINLSALIRDFGQDSEGKRILLEFGPGSGVAKHERSFRELADKFQDFAMSDALYYDLSAPISKLLDFKKIEGDLGQPLSLENRQSLVEYIKKAIVIKIGQTAAEKIEYDEPIRQSIIRDPNNLKEHLKNVGKQMELAEAVPSNQAIEQPDGPHYKEKFLVDEQSLDWQKVRELLIGGMERYLRDDFDEVDVYELLNAHPAGIILGDFFEIKKLKDEQIDFALGVRSTVYVERSQYSQFLEDICHKLKNGGVYIDDNVRENFGRYYRLSELMDLQKSLQQKRKRGEIDFDISISIVIGQGVKDEDFKEENTPIAVVITRGSIDKGLITKNLLADTRLVSLEGIVSDQEYLKTLDREGRVARAIEKQKTA